MRPAGLLSLLFLFTLATWAEESPDETRLRGEIKTLEQEFIVRGALLRLSVTEEQAAGLLAVARKAAEEKARYEEKMDAILQDELEAYAAFHEEDLQNVGFTPQVERCTAEAEHREKALNKEFADRIGELELEAPFTAEQREMLSLFRLQNPAAFFRKSDGREPAPARPKGEAERLRESLDEIHKEKYGAIEGAGMFLLLPALAGVLSERLGEPAPSATAAGAPTRDTTAQEVRDLREDINLTNLTNGMNYSVHQLAHLEKYATAASKRQPDAQACPAFDARLAARYRDAVARLLADLKDGKEPEPSAIRDAMRIRNQAGLEPPRGLGRPKDAHAEISDLVAATKEVLFESQRQVLLDYNPCLIPPKNLKDPVRVGQANDGSRAIAALERLRDIPEDRWEKLGEEVVDRALAKIEEAGGTFPPEERAQKLAELAGILDRARALDDFDFELEKAELAAELAAFDRLETLKDSLKEVTGDDAVLDQKIAAFLLHPRAVALYEIRATQLEDKRGTEPIDLDKISPADNCKDGHCAIDRK